MSNDASNPKSKTLTYILEGVILVMALLLGLAIRFWVYETGIVVSASMEPALQIDDRVLIDHRASLSGTWQRGDIVFFKPPPSWTGGETEDTGELLVKRVVGLPGETVASSGGQIWINGAPLQEPYLNSKADRDTPPISVVLAGDQYFVAGDNRDNSEDSRTFGPIPNSAIHGRAVRILWPLGRGSLSLPDYN
jgi:signal peptidase I